jgi:hypothetical protein
MSLSRQEYRTHVERDGTLRIGDAVHPCVVQDLSERGVLVDADVSVSPGDRVELEFQLTTGSPIRCSVEVKHTEAGRFGGAIVSISSDEQLGIVRFLEQLAELNLMGF